MCVWHIYIYSKIYNIKIYKIGVLSKNCQECPEKTWGNGPFLECAKFQLHWRPAGSCRTSSNWRCFRAKRFPGLGGLAPGDTAAFRAEKPGGFPGPNCGSPGMCTSLLAVRHLSDFLAKP